MCSTTGGGERLHNVLWLIGSKLWCPWQQKAPIDLLWGKWCLHRFSIAFDPIMHVTRTCIKSWTSLNCGQIGPLTTELAASGFHGPFICFLKWDLTLAHWTQMSDRYPLGYLFLYTSSIVRLICWHLTWMLLCPLLFTRHSRLNWPLWKRIFLFNLRISFKSDGKSLWVS